MTGNFMSTELEGVATFWRVARRDGITLGFTSHDHDLMFDGLLHRAAPGMLPSSIRRTASIERDSVEVQGVLSHDSISAFDLAEGRYGNARIAIGIVDWETLDRATLFTGELGTVSQSDGKFEAELQSAKASLEVDLVPRTSPTCRAVFCDAACRLNPAHHSQLGKVVAVDIGLNRVTFAGPFTQNQMLHGSVRWLDGPQAGIQMHVAEVDAAGLIVDTMLDERLQIGTRAYLREGCDHTIATCSDRFANAANFQGEPFLPGNDLLARYPTGAS